MDQIRHQWAHLTLMEAPTSPAPAKNRWIFFLGSHFVFAERPEMFFTVLPVEQIDGVNLPLPPSLR